MGTIKDLWRQQKNFILENYSEYGIDFCMERLGLSRRQITKRAQYLGVKLQGHDYLKDFFPISHESAYTLGFISGTGTYRKIKTLFR